MSPKEVHRRAHVFVALLALAFLALVAQMGNLQLRQGAALAATANSNQTRVWTTLAPRGVIYDRNRLLLADSRLAYTVQISYDAFQNTAVLRRLAEALHVDYGGLRQAVAKRMSSGLYYEPVPVKSDITAAEYTWVAEHHEELPGVFVLQQPVRDYPLGAAAGHVLRYVGLADEADVARRHLSPEDTVGKLGLEAYYDQVLRGKDGETAIQVDAAARPLEITRVTPPTPGDSLVLTLDSRVQRDAQRALDYIMYKIRHRVDNDGHVYRNASRGAAVMMDVRTGGILAMVSLPGYDPNVFVGNDAQAIAGLYDPKSLSPLWNRAIAGEYQPGSIFKLVTTAAAFTEGIGDPNRKIFCSGIYPKANKWDWLPGGHGWTDVYKAISQSCDVYYYQLGDELGIDKMVEYMRDMGLEKPTGVDLVGEEGGSIPTAAWRAARAESKDNPELWQLGDTLSAAIGQIVTATPLQLAQYTAWVANGGEKVRPHLVQEILDPSGNANRVIQPESEGRLKASPETLATIRDAMKLSPFGEGTAADGWWERFPIKVAAKTGTAENPPHDDFGTWVGFAPADHPRIAIAIVVEEAGHGGNLTPIARAMFASYFGITLPADDPAKIPTDWVVGVKPNG